MAMKRGRIMATRCSLRWRSLSPRRLFARRTGRRSRSIIIVPFGPGGGSDLIGRILAQAR